MQRTTRERIADRLRGESLSATALAAAFELSTTTVIEHVEHIARSLDDSDEQLLVAPPACEDCGFDGFDDRLNEPSRCPECHSENLSPPIFRIE
ncbi:MULTISPECIES: transcriptional regulator [unclassified Halorhabdus]|uniref:transcriptional regulator n=1 Tax=unclassified Halorhabdus TaxID=2621901 RepID=UPI0023DC29B3|nr:MULTISPECIES: transcriptional regulator [unclassified Halorhabdus]WEL18079.1 Transcriptional regulator containing an HTH domain fused to a Zn-ribbon [Halorhabdus sp. SVX81]WEL21962.1 Transcriptional regulator containing an HTH domain fused to a Zn-ribbon [Halorhabdus sp. BNX81]